MFALQSLILCALIAVILFLPKIEARSSASKGMYEVDYKRRHIHTESNTTYVGNLPDSEYQALYEFYVALNGDNWIWQNSTALGVAWNFSNNANPCNDNWQGIVCDYTTAPVFHVIELILDQINLRGRIPATITSLPELGYLELARNHLSGPIPSEIGDLSKLYRLGLGDNKLTGRLPDSLGNLVHMQILLLPYNELSGPLPDTMRHFKVLENLGLGVNHFSGHLPEWLGDIRPLSTLDLYFNHFSGSIPEAVCNLNFTFYLELQFNHFDGTIPDCLCNMQHLRNLGLYDNHFTGVLPDSVGAKSPYLQYVEIQNNFLHGTIPASYGDFRDLMWLSLQSNLLSGTIPPELSNLAQLSFISLRINKLTGTIPAAFSQLSALTELLLEHNLLTGNIHDLIDHTTMPSLQTIQLNDNRLTGTLPEEIFLLPRLLTFAAVSNCFQGPLPASVCGAVTLRSLVLDGLTSAESCHLDLFPHVSQSYSLVRSFGGSVPACLYTLPNITTLHLSGNEFTGTLPETAFSPSLLDLSLSHNLLTGTIPLHVQNTVWYCLDLSYNQLSGTLDSGAWSDVVIFDKNVFIAKYVTELALFRIQMLEGYNFTLSQLNNSHNILYTQLYLENNRLSGRIPGAVQDRVDISILGSNVFACNVDASDLPHNDAGVNRYQCGSDNFNTPYYIWLGLTLLTCVALCLVLYGYQIGFFRAYFPSEKAEILTRLYNFHSYVHFKSPQQQNPLSQYGRVISLYEFMLSQSLWCVGFTLLALLPLYVTLSAYNGTLTHQYAWAASAAYISGALSMALMLVFLLVLVAGVVCICMHRLNTGTIIARTEQSLSVKTVNETDTETEKESIVEVSVYDRYKMHAQNGLVYAAFLAVNLIIVIGVNVAYVYVAIYRNSHVLILSQILISLFKLVWNNIASALVLKEASRYLTQDKVKHSSADTRAVETRFTTLLIFIALFNNIVIPCLVVAVVSPNCFYNVFVPAPQVTSTYAYEICVLIDRITGTCSIRLPVLSETAYYPPFTYNYQCSSSLVTYYAPAFLNMCIMGGFITPLFQFFLYRLHQRVTPGTVVHRVLDRMLTRLLKPLRDVDAATVLQNYDPARPLFKAGRVLIILYTYLALLLTFGAVFPPLAVAIFVTLTIVAAVVRLRVGRFLNTALHLGLLELIDRIEHECVGVGELSVVRNAMWMLITVCCWFYTLFLFDTLGDAVGFNSAYWVLIVMPLMPLCIYAFSCMYVFYYSLPVGGPVSETPLDASQAVVINRLHSDSEGSGVVELSVERVSNQHSII